MQARALGELVRAATKNEAPKLTAEAKLLAEETRRLVADGWSELTEYPAILESALFSRSGELFK